MLITNMQQFESDKLTMLRKASLTHRREGASLCGGTASPMVYLTGGRQTRYIEESTADLYVKSIRESGSEQRFNLRSGNSWQDMPCLQMPRQHHVSCALGDSLYVFSGTRIISGTRLQSIEMLQKAATVNKYYGAWQYIRPQGDLSFQERSLLKVCSMPDEQHICILGDGYNSHEPQLRLYEPKTGTIKQHKYCVLDFNLGVSYDGNASRVTPITSNLIITNYCSPVTYDWTMRGFYFPSHEASRVKICFNLLCTHDLKHVHFGDKNRQKQFQFD